MNLHPLSLRHLGAMVFLCLLVDTTLWIRVAFAQAINPTLLTTFSNPIPTTNDLFGTSVAAVGADGVLVGAPNDSSIVYNAGAAFLFSTDGTFLTTFSKATPAANDQFGCSVAAIGTDRVLVGSQYDSAGALNAGAAYLFSTDGTLLTTFLKPNPVGLDQFGCSVAALGNDRVLVGALNAGGHGAAYLFTTNGTLLSTITNPFHVPSEWFGCSVAALGSDRIIIGAAHNSDISSFNGAAYLLSTNGALLVAFVKPGPTLGAHFGASVAALGSDRVLICAPRDSTDGLVAGAAYLFRTNGLFLTNFSKVTTGLTESAFGYSVASVGSNRVLIGSVGAITGSTTAGAAHLFSTNGTLLATFIEPSPAALDSFGCSVAAVGTDRVLIGAAGSTIRVTNYAGAAYLFSYEIPYPPLSIARIDTNFWVRWITDETSLVLQQTGPLAAPTVWSDTAEVVSTNGFTNMVLQAIPTAVNNRYFRLRRP
ncbi:MAG: hypothetical protein HY301_16020 [Verrucomicrobia bacterium]|nr:hypothetical protein [Verrucomicrobiota bacterium]